jgi:hypothetical protein
MVGDPMRAGTIGNLHHRGTALAHERARVVVTGLL